ncbi:3343_t:CDS:1, partial [Gigaspora margarita]
PEVLFFPIALIYNKVLQTSLDLPFDIKSPNSQYVLKTVYLQSAFINNFNDSTPIQDPK